MKRLVSIPVRSLALAAAFLPFASLPAHACTIFVLTDTNRAVFCNNEDWSDSKSLIWFLPAGEGYHGAVYVGFTNGYVMGGLNTEGLAYDWVGGYTEQWKPDPQLADSRGNSGQRMLETCATVDDAVAFYRSHNVPSFAQSKILVADRSGASVIIGVRDGRLTVEPANQCRGFGYGEETLDKALAKHPESTGANGLRILRDCRQGGDYATKYSNVFDLKNGDIFLLPIPGSDEEVTLNLAAELKKGAHYYEMPRIKEQLAQARRPLPLNLKRFPVDEFKPIPDREPEVTTHLRAMIVHSIAGAPHADDYTADAWKKVWSKQEQTQADLKKIGDFTAMTLVGRSDENGQRVYEYRLEFAKVTLIQRFVLDKQNKLSDGGSEAVEVKPGATLVEQPVAQAGPLCGIGVALDTDGGNIIIKAIIPGSPAAAEKDLHVGDRIIGVAQDYGPIVPVRGGQTAEAVVLIRGAAGTTVRLKIVSAGQDEAHAREVSMMRAALKLPLH